MTIQAVVTVVRGGRTAIKIIASEAGHCARRIVAFIHERPNATPLQIYDHGRRHGLDAHVVSGVREPFGGLVVMTPSYVLTAYEDLPPSYRDTFHDKHHFPFAPPVDVPYTEFNWREPDPAPDTQLFVCLRSFLEGKQLLSEPVSECGFQLGDVVTFTNDEGVEFHGYHIIGFRPRSDFRPRATVYLDKDSWWFPVEPACLTLVKRADSPPIQRLAANS